MHTLISCQEGLTLSGKLRSEAEQLLENWGMGEKDDAKDTGKKRKAPEAEEAAEAADDCQSEAALCGREIGVVE